MNLTPDGAIILDFAHPCRSNLRAGIEDDTQLPSRCNDIDFRFGNLRGSGTICLTRGVAVRCAPIATVPNIPTNNERPLLLLFLTPQHFTEFDRCRLPYDQVVHGNNLIVQANLTNDGRRIKDFSDAGRSAGGGRVEDDAQLAGGYGDVKYGNAGLRGIALGYVAHRGIGPFAYRIDIVAPADDDLPQNHELPLLLRTFARQHYTEIQRCHALHVLVVHGDDLIVQTNLIPDGRGIEYLADVRGGGSAGGERVHQNDPELSGRCDDAQYFGYGDAAATGQCRFGFVTATTTTTARRCGGLVRSGNPPDRTSRNQRFSGRRVETGQGCCFAGNDGFDVLKRIDIDRHATVSKSIG
mmetsp:Transcript_28238/g.58856  ORF Transcript_28238/g.58856 Transcript_28238/m.58856 type:complete len:354 (-) Transcript_28238:861-1922(-)